MNKSMLRAVAVIILLLVMFATTNCTNKLELQEEDRLAKVCTQWGTPSAKIRNLMKTYTQLSSSSGVIVYKGKGDTEAISYRFVADSLCASMVIMKSEKADLLNIRKSLSGYEALGEYNSNELFVNGKQLITIKEYVKNEIPYTAVGYIPFDIVY